MSIIGAMNNAVTGINSAAKLAEKSAAGISRMATDGDTEIAQHAVNLKLARHSLEMNAAVIEKANEAEEHLIDIIA